MENKKFNRIKDIFLMSRFNIFYKYEILSNINYILLDFMENSNNFRNKKSKEEMRKIIYLISSNKFKEMRKYILEDFFFK